MKPLTALTYTEVQSLFNVVFPKRSFTFEEFYIGTWLEVPVLTVIIRKESKATSTVFLRRPEILSWLQKHDYDTYHLTK